MEPTPERHSRAIVAPLVPAALAVMAGVVVDRYGEPFGTRAWAGLALVGGVIGLLCWRWTAPAVVGIVVALVALGGGWHHCRWSDLEPEDLAWGVAEVPRPAWVRGVVREALGVRPGDGADPGDSATTRAVLDITALCDGRHWRQAQGRAQLVIRGSLPDLAAGQAVEAAGTLASVAGPLNPGEFDYRGYLRAQGVRMRLNVDDPEGVRLDPVGSGGTLARWVGTVRAWSHARLVAGLEPRVAPLAAALLLGRREGVDPEVNDAFARTGTTHLLAISGLHLQVLAGALWFAFRAAGLGRRGAFGAVAAATLAYALLVGLMPSVVRSAAMTCTVCAAGFLHRRARSANTLALAALVTLGLNPAHLFDVGCQLSFLAIAAILWGVEPAADLIRFGYYAVTFRFQGPSSPLDALERTLAPWWIARMRRWPLLLTSGLTVSAVVWLAALPLVALRFHVVSPIGILLNVPLVPLTSLALMAAGLALSLSAAHPSLEALPAWVCARCLGWTEDLVRWGASRSWGHAFVAGPSWAWVLGFYALLALATAAWAGRPRNLIGAGTRAPSCIRTRTRRWAWTAPAAWVVLGAIVWAVPRGRGVLEAEVLAVGHGLAVIVQTGDGRALLYDCGRMRDPSVGRRIIAPALWARGLNRLDTIVLSHADADHYNGLPDLLERFAIGSVRVPPGFSGPANPGAVALLDQVRRRGVPVRGLAEGDGWQSAGTRFAVWHPPRVLEAGRLAIESDNARSIVLEVDSGGRRLLLTGDLEREGLDRLLARPAPSPIDAFLAPHHGGRTANPERLYAWARPRLVIVSQRPPAPGTRDALAPIEAQGVPLFRTWQRGAVRLRWEPRGVKALGFLEDAAPRETRTRPPRTTLVRGLVALTGFALGLAGRLVLGRLR